MKNIMQEITKYKGSFRGTGINHENEKFIGQLEIVGLLDNKGFQIIFSAHADSSQEIIFHSEFSTIAPNPNGGISLFNLNTNTPFLTEHLLVSSDLNLDHRELIFRFGEIENRGSFREEIRLDLLSDGRVGYHYSWGLPGGDFVYRSGAVMEKILLR